jgi:hypothetical protein
VDSDAHNDKIDDRIIAGIRSSYATVVDVTTQKMRARTSRPALRLDLDVRWYGPFVRMTLLGFISIQGSSITLFGRAQPT